MDIPTPTEGKLEELVRRIAGQAAGRVPAAEKARIEQLGNQSSNLAALASEYFAHLARFAGAMRAGAAMQMARNAPTGDLATLKKARALMNKDIGGAAAIESFERGLYYFAISFGELCSKIQPGFDQTEVQQAAAWAARMKRSAPDLQQFIEREALNHWKTWPKNLTNLSATARALMPGIKPKLAELAPREWSECCDSLLIARIRKRLERVKRPLEDSSLPKKRTGRQQSSKIKHETL